MDEDGEERSVTAPLSLIVSGFAPVDDARLALTPELRRDVDSTLLLVDLGRGANRLGASALAQVHVAIGDVPPDVDDPAELRGFFGVPPEVAMPAAVGGCVGDRFLGLSTVGGRGTHRFLAPVV